MGPVAFETKELANRGQITKSQVNYHFGNPKGPLVEAMTRILVDHINDSITRDEAETKRAAAKG